MTNINNSISTTLTKFTKLLNNSLEGYNKFTEAMISNSKEIYIEIVDESGNIKKIPIAGYQYILKEIERLNININQLSGLTEDKVTTVKIDDTFRRILMSTYKKEATDINQLDNVNNFIFKNNHFFESLLNPALFISFDLSSQIDMKAESVLMERYMFSKLSDIDRDWFNTNYLNKNNIDHSLFIEDIYSRGIVYKLDNDTVTLPTKEIIYSGNFSVLNISEVEIDEVISGKTYKRKRKSYKLDKLTYTDLRYNFEDNLILKENDILVLNSDDSTAYKIIAIDRTSNSIVLELRDGYGRIKMGDNILRFHSENNVQTKVDIGIGFNEYNVIFIKSISSDYKIPSKHWSSGVAFFTNDLSINTNGAIENLESFYKREVIDFGVYLQSLAEDKIIPTSLGIQPNSTTLSETDFKVIQINKQINDNNTIQEIKDLENEKIRLQSEIIELNKAIKNDNLNTTLINQKITKSELYNSIVREIDSKSKSISSSEFIPKYRIRGFFPIPDLKYSDLTGEQHIVRFLISYRYISVNGAASTIDQIEFNDNGIKRYGVYSNWIEVYSNTKARQFNEITGLIEWVDEKVEDANTININSIDIPINNNEIVEIRVKAISAAGYPNNPLVSDWSNTIQVTFPIDLNSSNIINSIVESNKKDLVRVDLQNELTSIGVYKHVQTSIDKVDKYFVHSTNDIASGFLSPEQNIISLFDKLIEYNKKITLLEETLAKKIPVINVKLIDSDGNEISIKNDRQNKVFAGYYTDYVQDLNIVKGKIITKTYFLIIENLTASNLELISRIPGSITKRVNRSEVLDNVDSIQVSINPAYENYNTYDSTDIDYLSMRKYDLVPILLNNTSSEDGEIISYSPYQSAQVKSQFIYNRYKDIAKELEFYSYYIPDENGTSTGTQFSTVADAENKFGRTTTVNSTGFIWGGDFDSITDLPTKTSTFQSNDNTIEVHVNHPYLTNRTKFKTIYNQVTGNTSTDDYINEAKELFKHSKFMNLKSDSELGRKQSIYVYDENERTVKMSFESDDTYLLGKQTCGAYLFTASDSHESITVDGKSLLSKKIVEYGNANSIKIPILFQFRMTDYYGDDNNGLGNIGGDVNQLLTNITYIKEIGFDIYDSNNNQFSFDLEISAKYKSDNLNLDKLPVKKVGMALDDIAKNLENFTITPKTI